MKRIKNGDVTCGEYDGEDIMFWLPHQCDEWVIGDIEDAKEFVRDLQKTIEEAEALNK